jgi:hypothetical protein
MPCSTALRADKSLLLTVVLGIVEQGMRKKKHFCSVSNWGGVAEKFFSFYIDLLDS